MIENLLAGLSLSTLDWSELFLRVMLAMVFGLVLGLDRDRKNKPIDFRAYMIVATTTCIVAILGLELHTQFSQAQDFVSLDLGKIISGALTGIGFLGAGAIIHRDGGRVVGTATGASIWAAGGIGLALGFGLYALAIVAFLAVSMILIGGGFAMHKFHGADDKEDL